MPSLTSHFNPLMLLPSSILVLVWTTSVAAQAITQCEPFSSWWHPLRNKVLAHPEDPCEVARLMKMKCNVTTTTQPLTSPEFTAQTNSCLCRGETYAVYGGCLACQQTQQPQSFQFPPWATWSLQCSRLSTSPPFEIDVPTWAKTLGSEYELGKKNFNIDEVMKEAVKSTSLATLPGGSTLVTTQTDTANPTSTTVVVVGDTPANSASSSKSNTGPIIGGVVGGLIALAILVGILLFLRRRKRAQHIAPSSEFTKYHQKPVVHPASPPSPTSVPLNGGSVSGAGGASYTPLRQGSGDDSGIDEELPGFTPGKYTGPIYEKPGQYISDPNSPLHTNSLGHSTSHGIARQV